jgi:hypothetical protein
LTFLKKTNAYVVTQKGDAYNYIACGKLWPPVVQLELDADILKFKYHTLILFNVDDDTFQVHTPYKQVHTPYKLGVKKEVR